MKMKGIIYFDLDGTLLNQKSIISGKNKELIKKLHNKGYLSVIASGRSPKEIEDKIRDTAIHSYISLNGQYLCVEKDTIINHELGKKDIEEITQFSARLSHPLAYYSNDSYAINFIDDTAEKLYKLDHAPLPKMIPNYYQSEKIYMLYLFNESKEKDELYKKRFEHTFTFFRDSPYSLAVVQKGISKKSGILELNEVLKCAHIQNTFAFGDGMNDVTMFETVTHSIAMGNAQDEVKVKADFVTKSNVDDGIEFALKHFKLI